MTTPKRHTLSAAYYSLADVKGLAEQWPAFDLAPDVAERVEKGAAFVRGKVEAGDYIYGVTTGFGSLCENPVEADEVEALQRNHVVSHACGVGEVVPEHHCRLVALFKLLTFRSGHTGISLTTVQRFVDLLNAGIVPAIPKKGTVGASGDLAPLAHMALVLLGLGHVYRRGKLVPGGEALAEMGWDPIRLGPKEGLALTNGVQYITALAAAAVLRLEELVRWADLIAAVSIQGFSASRTFYQAAYHETSHHEERRTVAANLRQLLEGSNHWDLPTCNRSKQDPYSFRCIPQVHGAVRQTLGHCRDVVERELNGVSDNPLFFADRDEVLFGGNLHGESVALAMDFLAIAATELASISERRTYQLLSGQRGLPSFLVRRPGVNSGFMIAQYTSAALVNQCKVLSTPASVDTIPTCQLQEDHVSMGGTSAYKLLEIIENVEYVLGVELLLAVQATELNEGLKLSPPVEKVCGRVREGVAPLESDRVLSTDMEECRRLVQGEGERWVAELS